MDTLDTINSQGQGDKERGDEETRSAKTCFSSDSTKASAHSQLTSASRKSAATKVAANEATLQVLLKQECHIEKLQRLEAEVAQLKAKQEAENADRQRVLEAKLRKLERLEMIKTLLAAKAQQQIYEQSECSRLTTQQFLSEHSQNLLVPAVFLYLNQRCSTKAIDSYFLLGTESAYLAAWCVLEERYGSPFLTAKAFRDKIDALPKISAKGSLELQEFVDFLCSCESAMPQIRSLEVLNDCHENQKILAKLPDWLTSRWNQKVIEVVEESQMFPSLSQFVKFLTHEAKITCNPVTSLHGLKPSEGEKKKVLKNRSLEAKALVMSSDEKANVTSCVFCEKATIVLKPSYQDKWCLVKKINPSLREQTWDGVWSDMVIHASTTGDAIGVSHQVIVTQVIPGLQSSSDLISEVHYVCRTQIKKVIFPADVIKVLESDFAERASESSHVSQEDLRFLSKLKEGIILKSDGHYEIPLPFKKDRPNLLDNKVCAIHCLKCLERKLRRDEQYNKDYKAFMHETITCGDAERVQEEDIHKTPA
ncbi:hypothetical protein SRHO_G00288750 [Serrasalmus rhombeus]